MEFLIQNFDNLIKIGLVTFGAFGFYYALKHDISTIKIEIGHIKENQRTLVDAISKLNNILTQVAVQDTRLNMIEKKLDELAHGFGYVHKQG